MNTVPKQWQVCAVYEMVKGVQKNHLPQKTCLVCHRPFRWRKKWERNWADVLYCSEACRKRKKEMP